MERYENAVGEAVNDEGLLKGLEEILRRKGLKGMEKVLDIQEKET